MKNFCIKEDNKGMYIVSFNLVKQEAVIYRRKNGFPKTIAIFRKK